jgi:hypothetical protein
MNKNTNNKEDAYMSQHTLQDIVDICDKNNIGYYKMDTNHHIDSSNADFDKIYDELMSILHLKTKLTMTGRTISVILRMDPSYDTPLFQIINMKGCSSDQLVDFYNKYSDNKYICMCHQSEALIDYLNERNDRIEYYLGGDNPIVIHFGIFRYSCYDIDQLKTISEVSENIVKEQCKYTIKQFRDTGEISGALKQFLSFSPKHINAMWYGIKGDMISNLYNKYTKSQLEDMGIYQGVRASNEHYINFFLSVYYIVLIQAYYDLTIYYRNNRSEYSKEEASWYINAIDSLNNTINLDKSLVSVADDTFDFRKKQFKQFRNTLVKKLSTLQKIIESVDTKEQKIKFTKEFTDACEFAEKYSGQIDSYKAYLASYTDK